MRRLEATGTYIDDEINRLAKGGKQRGHIAGVGRPRMKARLTASTKSESDRCGDEEEGADHQDDEDEDGDGDTKYKSTRCSNAGNGVELRCPTLLHRKPALPNAKAIEYHEWLLQQEARPRLTRTPIFRDREDAERRLRADYFDDHCKYPLYYFRRRFRMSRKLFLRIVNDIVSYTANPLPQHFHFFTSRLDCTSRMSISARMKCTAAIRQFAYASTAAAFDEYLQMSEHAARDALFFFNMCIMELYMPKGDKKYPTIMLEAVASQDLLIWHAFYGIAGTNNDINVLDNFPLFDDLLDDLAPVVSYVVNGVEYRNGYYLADRIYPEWASFVKSFTVATDPKHTYF
nr:hypothetical protein [Tanacetum cinerariifolium]